MLRELSKACIVSASLIMILGLGGAWAYEFGSKVAAGDTDVSRLLYNCAPTPVPRFWDIGPAGYDENDPVYLDLIKPDTTKSVDANDLRLSSQNRYLAGTQVKASDDDLGKPLTDFLPNPPAIVFTDLYGIAGYDFADPVYLTKDNSQSKVLTSDLRLSRVGVLPGGTKVLDYHEDHDKPNDPTYFTYRYFNTNGDEVAGAPVYDLGDHVYLDISVPATDNHGAVVVNDVRLFAHGT
jgi:hypothetical protein